ncbi:hypothetical protein [Deinococcus hopiensis]|nr:hypothetical protein [Deinococcus hopiensis]
MAGLAWFYVVQPAREFLASWQPPAQVQTTAQQSGGTKADAPLTTADVQRFVRVRREVKKALGSSFTNVQQVWTDIQNGQSPSVVTVLNVVRGVGSGIGQARQAQTAALAKEGMGAARYAAVRREVNRALGLPEVDFAEAANALQQGRFPDLNTTVQTATASERALVAPFREELTKTAAAGLLGL